MYCPNYCPDCQSLNKNGAYSVKLDAINYSAQLFDIPKNSFLTSFIWLLFKWDNINHFLSRLQQSYKRNFLYVVQCLSISHYFEVRWSLVRWCHVATFESKCDGSFGVVFFHQKWSNYTHTVLMEQIRFFF